MLFLLLYYLPCLSAAFDYNVHDPNMVVNGHGDRVPWWADAAVFEHVDPVDHGHSSDYEGDDPDLLYYPKNELIVLPQPSRTEYVPTTVMPMTERTKRTKKPKKTTTARPGSKRTSHFSVV